jgi:hypothetical protein
MKLYSNQILLILLSCLEGSFIQERFSSGFAISWFLAFTGDKYVPGVLEGAYPKWEPLSGSGKMSK